VKVSNGYDLRYGLRVRCTGQSEHENANVVFMGLGGKHGLERFA